jgi:hypothetical protein
VPFELADGRRIGYPDDEFAPELVWLDHAQLKVAKELKPGEQFTYVFRSRGSVGAPLRGGDPEG